jgi:hypothetical protein
MARLLLTLDYYKYLFPPDCDAAAVIKAFSGVTKVSTHKESYNDPDSYKIDRSKLDISLNFIQDDQLVTDEEADVIDVKAAKKEAADAGARASKYYTELQEVKAELKAMKSLCPETHQKEESPSDVPSSSDGG